MTCACGKPLSGTCCSEQLTGCFHLHTPEHPGAHEPQKSWSYFPKLFPVDPCGPLEGSFGCVLRWKIQQIKYIPITSGCILWTPTRCYKLDTRLLTQNKHRATFLVCSLFTTQSRQTTAKHKDTDFPQVEKQVHFRISILLYDLHCGTRGGL